MVCVRRLARLLLVLYRDAGIHAVRTRMASRMALGWAQVDFWRSATWTRSQVMSVAPAGAYITGGFSGGAPEPPPNATPPSALTSLSSFSYFSPTSSGRNIGTELRHPPHAYRVLHRLHLCSSLSCPADPSSSQHTSQEADTEVCDPCLTAERQLRWIGRQLTR